MARGGQRLQTVSAPPRPSLTGICGLLRGLQADNRPGHSRRPRACLGSRPDTDGGGSDRTAALSRATAVPAPPRSAPSRSAAKRVARLPPPCCQSRLSPQSLPGQGLGDPGPTPSYLFIKWLIESQTSLAGLDGCRTGFWPLRRKSSLSEPPLTLLKWVRVWGTGPTRNRALSSSWISVAVQRRI